MGIFDAKSIEFSELEVEEELQTSSADGKGFAASGGVANAVKMLLRKLILIKKSMLSVHKDLQSVKNAYFSKSRKIQWIFIRRNGMSGGCVGGAGVLSDAKRAEIKLKQEMANSQLKNSSETYYVVYLKLITEEDADK